MDTRKEHGKFMLNRPGNILCHGFLSNIVQVRTEQLGAFDIVPPVKFLVDRVSGISRGAHGEQQHILPCGFFKGKSDGDTVIPISIKSLHLYHHWKRCASANGRTYLPPSRVISGSTPKTCLTALLAAPKFQCFGLAAHQFPSC